MSQQEPKKNFPSRSQMRDHEFAAQPPKDTDNNGDKRMLEKNDESRPSTPSKGAQENKRIFWHAAKIKLCDDHKLDLSF